jgi:alkylation response protein AidB-like acyl-CoA dehydrogenase
MTAGGRYAEFFDAELAPLVRRMADRPRDGRSADAEAGNRQIRAMIWDGLVGLGAPSAVLPGPDGGDRTGLAGDGGDRTGLAGDGGDRTGLAGDGGDRTGLADLTELLGSMLYQGPLLDTLVAGELLHRAGADKLLAEVVGGAAVALAVLADAAGPAEPAALIADGDLIHGRRAFVGFAAEVDYLVVVGATDAGVRIALTPRDHPAVAVRRYEEVSRGELFEVQFSGAPVLSRLGDGADWRRALAGARVRQAGYLVGLAQGALDLAVAYAKQRRQFGKPIGRFQALSFRLSELSVRIDAARLLTRAAAAPAGARVDELAAMQALATAAELARAVTTAAMQINGAAGMLAACDTQLFYRHAAVEALRLGSPTQLRAEAAPLLASRQAA